MAREVIFSPEAETDLLELYDYIAARSGPERAMAYLDRIEAYCLGFGTGSERGRLRSDLRSGLRLVGFERRLTIAFHVDDTTVTIDRIMYGGRNVERIFKRKSGNS